MVTDTLDVELQFRKLPDQGRDEVYDVWLLDQTQGTSDLPSRIESIRVTPAAVIPDLGMSATQFVNHFRNLSGLTDRDGLQFGQWLHDILFPASSEQRQTWDEVCARAMREGRPVRLQVSFADLARREHHGLLATLPYELLATSGSFLFRRKHWSIVRAFRGLDGATFELEPGHHIGLMWANPKNGDSKLPPALFDKHESHIATHGTSLGFHVQQPRRQATRQTLQDMVTAHTKPLPSLDVLSIVAHGSPGKLWLHHLGHQNYPDDPGEPIAASEFANHLRSAGVKVGMLWSCHGAEPDSDFGSVVHALLRDGGLVAVVGSQAALRAETATTPEFARELLNSLATTAEGHLDRAVSAARCVLPASDLQWAAPLYFARPLRGRSVSLAIPERTLESLQQRWSLTSAPDRSPHFKGRETDLAELLQAVRTCRCLTLTGLPGAGKSEMARELMERLAQLPAGPQRPVTDAVWVALAAVRTAADVRSKIAAVLELKDADTDELLARQLKSHQTLLVLDNAEDVLAQDRAGFRILLETVLHNASGMQVLLTSRQELGDLEGVICRQRRVDLLPTPYDREAFVSAAGERLSEEDRASAELTRLVEILEGHPRSLMLIAGQVGRGRNLTRLREFLEQDTIDALTAYDLIGSQASTAQAAGNDDQLRARRLASSLNLSFAALQAESPAAADAYCWLGLFPSGLPTVLLPHVFGAEADELSVLWLRHSLVQILGPDCRVALPTPLRWYARRRINEISEAQRTDWFGRISHVVSRWLQHLLHVVHKVGGQRGVIAASNEIQNLDALSDYAIENSASSKDFGELGKAVAAWADVERFAGRPRNSIDHLMGALSKLEGRSKLGDAYMLTALAESQVRSDKLGDAEHNYNRALPLFRETEDFIGEADVLRLIGELMLRMHRKDKAQSHFVAALFIYHRINDHIGKVNTLRALGDLHVRREQLIDAVKCHRGALKIARNNNYRLGEANALQSLSEVFTFRNSLEMAEKCLSEACSIYRAIGDQLGEANCCERLGDLQWRTGRLGDAKRSLETAISTYQKIEHRLGEAESLVSLANVQRTAGLFPEASQNYSLALGIFSRAGEELGVANTLQALGIVAMDLGRPRAGFNQLLNAVKIYTTINDSLGLVGVLVLLSRAAIESGECARAVVLAYEAWQRQARISDHVMQPLALQELGMSLAAQKDPADLAAWYLAWADCKVNGDSAAQQIAQMFATVIPNFGAQQIDTEFAAECRETLKAVVTRYQTELNTAGVDPLSPLSEE